MLIPWCRVYGLTMVDPEGVTISKRYSGAGRNALGGYLAGLLIDRLGGAGSVTLRRPLAVGSRVTFELGEPNLLLDDAGSQVAHATALGELAIVPPIVSLEDARRAAAGYPGLRGHLFPRCFCCGPMRDPNDGLRIFPGPVGSGGTVAAAWSTGKWLAPGSSAAIPAEIVCSALDCPAIWALICATDPASTEMAVTGRLEIRIDGQVEPGRDYVVVGWPIGSDGRKRFAGAAIEAADDGSVLAVARQTMIVTDSGVPLGLTHWASPMGPSRTSRRAERD